MNDECNGFLLENTPFVMISILLLVSKKIHLLLGFCYEVAKRRHSCANDSIPY